MMKNKKPPLPKTRTKPVGKIGPIVVGGGKPAEFLPVKFPEDKRTREEFIARRLILGLRNTGRNFYHLVERPVQNPENDFDFTLKTASGKEYLEIMEIAPLDEFGGSFEKAPFEYNHGKMADMIWRKILSKSKKYCTQTSLPVHLLMYVTDWRFQFSPGILALFGFWASRQHHGFKTILYFVLNTLQKGNAKIIFPVEKGTFANFNEKAARNRKTLLANPNELRSFPDGSFEVPLGSSKLK